MVLKMPLMVHVWQQLIDCEEINFLVIFSNNLNNYVLREIDYLSIAKFGYHHAVAQHKLSFSENNREYVLH